MHKIFVPPKEFSAAGIVAENVTIITVRLKRAQIDCPFMAGDNANEAINFAFRWQASPHVIPSPGQLNVDIDLEAIFSKGETKVSNEKGLDVEGSKKDRAHILLGYELRYAIPQDPIPDEIEQMGGIEAFARWNSLYTCWPYFRQELDHICGASMLPRIPLPLIKLVPKQDEEKQK